VNISVGSAIIHYGYVQHKLMALYRKMAGAT